MIVGTVSIPWYQDTSQAGVVDRVEIAEGGRVVLDVDGQGLRPAGQLAQHGDDREARRTVLLDDSDQAIGQRSAAGPGVGHAVAPFTSEEVDDAAVDLVGLLELEEVARVFDDVDGDVRRDGGPGRLGHLDADAAVRGAVEVERGLGRHPLGGCLDLVERRVLPSVAQAGPVVAEGRLQVGRIPERRFEERQLLRRRRTPVTSRPTACR